MKKIAVFILAMLFIVACSEGNTGKDSQKPSIIVEDTTVNNNLEKIEKTFIENQKVDEESNERKEVTILEDVGLKIISPEEWGKVVTVGVKPIGTFYFGKIGNKGSNLGENTLNNIPFNIYYWSYKNVIDHNKIVKNEDDVFTTQIFNINDKIYNNNNIIEKICEGNNSPSECYGVKELKVGNKKIYRIGVTGFNGDVFSYIDYIYIEGDKNFYLSIDTLYDNNQQKELEYKIVDRKILRNLYLSEGFKDKIINIEKLGLTEKDFEPLDAVAKEFFSSVEFENTLTEEERNKKIKIIQQQYENRETK